MTGQSRFCFCLVVSQTNVIDELGKAKTGFVFRVTIVFGVVESSSLTKQCPKPGDLTICYWSSTWLDCQKKFVSSETFHKRRMKSSFAFWFVGHTSTISQHLRVLCHQGIEEGRHHRSRWSRITAGREAHFRGGQLDPSSFPRQSLFMFPDRGMCAPFMGLFFSFFLSSLPLSLARHE